MRIISPDITVHKSDHADDSGVTSFVTVKFVYPDDHVAYVHLEAEKATEIGMQLCLVAAEVSPEVVW